MFQAPEEVTTDVKPTEENKDVEKTIPLAAAHFEPTGFGICKSGHYFYT